ncbi:hypothetical protein BDD12DRAFT_870384 [Trichophaea hybrida]|nr:hypothetical protein BDD12DRAFT_870384 [Trichophaea hybrida]
MSNHQFTPLQYRQAIFLIPASPVNFRKSCSCRALWNDLDFIYFHSSVPGYTGSLMV